MFRLTLYRKDLISLIRKTNHLDTMFGLAHSNDVLTDDELWIKIKDIFVKEVSVMPNISLTKEDVYLHFDLVDNNKLDIDGKFRAFKNTGLVGVVTLLNFTDPSEDN